MTSALSNADAVIATLKKSGIDYTEYRDQIALVWNEGIWEGNWDSTTELDGAKDLRMIQEDEYDQSMDEDEKPPFEEQIAYIGGCYIFWV